MKTFTLKTLAVVSGMVALASLAVLPAYADTPQDESMTKLNFESTKSNEQVREEYFQAMKEGTLAKATDSEVDADAPSLAKAAPSDIQRHEVLAETVEWMRTKEADIGMGE